MFVHLSRELARAERLKSEVALIVMDIDGFKAINDTYGHNVGDHALREMSLTRCRARCGPYDLCVRYAGDEFIVVLTDCSREAAELKRRELQAADRRDRARSARRQAAAPGRQRRRRGLPARRHDLRRRCSPTPTTGCIATRRRAAATCPSRHAVGQRIHRRPTLFDAARSGQRRSHRCRRRWRRDTESQHQSRVSSCLDC